MALTDKLNLKQSFFSDYLLSSTDYCKITSQLESGFEEEEEKNDAGNTKNL